MSASAPLQEMIPRIGLGIPLSSKYVLFASLEVHIGLKTLGTGFPNTNVPRRVNNIFTFFP